VCQCPGEGACGYNSLLSCTWGEEGSGRASGAGLAGWKEAEHLACHPSEGPARIGVRICKNFRTIWYRVEVPPWHVYIQAAAPLQGCCSCPAGPSSPEPPPCPNPLCRHLPGCLTLPICPENMQCLMIDLGSTQQGGTAAASRQNPLCWDHLAFSRAGRATCLLSQGTSCCSCPARGNPALPVPHSNASTGTGSVQPSLQRWVHLA